MTIKETMAGLQTRVPKEVFAILDQERGNFSMSGYLANLLIIYTEEITRDRMQTSVQNYIQHKENTKEQRTENMANF